MNARHRESGTVLLVVVVLLLLASIMGIFALNAGVFEQRSSRNDLRTKLVHGVAEAGLSQAMEYLHQHPDLLDDSAAWSPCLAADTTFPCGAVPASRRATMWYWSRDGHDFDGDGSISGWEERMLPVAGANIIDTAGNGFSVQYGVGAVICRIAAKSATTDPTVCTTFDAADATTTSAITLVSVADLGVEGARTTLVQSVGSYNLLGDLTNAPPILASGSVDLTGGLQVVTNPNSGGTGVPVSIWTRKEVNKTGTPNTCYYNEFLYNSSGTPNGTIYADPASPNFPLCDDCNCAGADSLSFTNSGNAVDAGIDILQDSGLNGDYSLPLDTTKYANYDVDPTEFPCDSFAQLFKISAWEDTDADHFCDQKLMVDFKDPNSGAVVKMGADEAYLFENAKTIINPTAAGAALATAEQLATPAGVTYPSDKYSGLIWCQSNCTVGSKTTLGSPENPVLLVVDSGAEMKIQGTVFGMVFLRALAKDGSGPLTLTPASGYKMDSTEVGDGGSASLRMNAGAAVYGAVIIQGKMTKANGNSAVIYNSDILSGLAKGGDFTKFVGLPGGWTDRVSY